jgi:hypothetical protein
MRIKTAVIHFKDPFDDESSSLFFAVEADFPWELVGANESPSLLTGIKLN